MNKFAAIGGLSLVVLGALWLSGSSTLLLGVRQGVPDLALPALLVVLEIASVVGTALWVTAQHRKARVRPVVVVVLSSTVAAIGGWLAYGPLGLVAPMAVVLVTDMIAERWADTAAPAQAVRPAEDPGPAQLAQVAELFPVVPEPVPTPDEPSRTMHEETRPLVSVDQLDDLSRDELRTVAREYDLTVRGSADELRARLRPVLAHVPHEVTA